MGSETLPCRTCREKMEPVRYFGSCPECLSEQEHLHDDGYVNIGRSHYFICKKHRLYWPAGSNLFSSWKEEEESTWKRNAKMLERYRKVEPVHAWVIPQETSQVESYSTVEQPAPDNGADDIPF